MKIFDEWKKCLYMKVVYHTKNIFLMSKLVCMMKLYWLYLMIHRNLLLTVLHDPSGIS